MVATPGNLKRSEDQYIMQQKMIARARMDRITELLIQGYNLVEITKIMDLTYKMVYTLKKKLDKRMKAIRHDTVEQLRDIKDRQYEWALKQCLEQWEASKVNSKGEPKRADVMFMDRILAIFEAQRKMHGVDVVKNKEDDTKYPPGFDWSSLTSNRQLTTVNVNVNGTSAHNSVEVADNIVVEQVKHAINNKPVTTGNIKDEVEARIKQLEHRAALREEREEQRKQSEENVARLSTVPIKRRKIVIKASPTPVDETVTQDSALSSLLE